MAQQPSPFDFQPGEPQQPSRGAAADRGGKRQLSFRLALAVGLSVAGCLVCSVGPIAYLLSSGYEAPSLYARTKSDDNFVKRMTGKKVTVSGTIADNPILHPDETGVGVYLAHMDRPGRFVQDRVMVVFVPDPNRKERWNYKGFDLRFQRGMVIFPFSVGERITVTGTYRYNPENDMLTIVDATLH